MKRVLIGVDGSTHAKSAVRYVGRLAAHDPEIRVDLVSVTDHVPHGLYDPSGTYDPRGPHALEAEWERAYDGWMRDQQARARPIFEDARQVLAAEGVAPDSVGEVVEECGRSVARTLIAAAREGSYDTLVVGRRGVSLWNEFAFGGATEELLRQPIGLHIWVVEEEAQAPEEFVPRVLVAIDGSETSLRALRYAAAVLGPAEGYTVTLGHVRSRRNPTSEKVLAEARQVAVEAGMKETALKAISIDGAEGVAAGLLAEAMNGKHGTIVIGRRGHSTVYQFLFGGVTERLLRYPTGHTIWVVE